MPGSISRAPCLQGVKPGKNAGATCVKVVVSTPATNELIGSRQVKSEPLFGLPWFLPGRKSAVKEKGRHSG